MHGEGRAFDFFTDKNTALLQFFEEIHQSRISLKTLVVLYQEVIVEKLFIARRKVFD